MQRLGDVLDGLTAWAPKSSKASSSFPFTCSWTLREIEMPPGSASPSRRAAIFTPSP
jgi:hypothetical protein